MYFLIYANPVLGEGWHPREFEELLLEEEGMDAGWPGTPANAHYPHIGRKGLDDVLFS